MKKYFVLSLFLVMALSTLLLNFACQPTVTGPGFPAALKTAIASYTPVPTGTQSPTSTPFPTATPCNVYMGDGILEVNGVPDSSATLYLNQYFASSNTTLNSLSLGVTAGTGLFQGVIYSNTSTNPASPAAYLGSTSPQSFVQGWNSAPLTASVPVTNGGYYWIGFISNGTVNANVLATTTPLFAVQSSGVTFNSFPSVFNGQTFNSAVTQFSVYVCQ